MNDDLIEVTPGVPIVRPHAINNPASFEAEAAHQPCCAVCKSVKARWHPHHVIYQQELRRQGLPLHDPRCALRVCWGQSNCHNRHHLAIRKIKIVELTDDNLEFAFEQLGTYAYDYLRRYYAGEDERMDAWLTKSTSLAEAT